MIRVDLKRVDDWVFIYLLKTELISRAFLLARRTLAIISHVLHLIWSKKASAIKRAENTRIKSHWKNC